MELCSVSSASPKQLETADVGPMASGRLCVVVSIVSLVVFVHIHTNRCVGVARGKVDVALDTTSVLEAHPGPSSGVT